VTGRDPAEREHIRRVPQPHANPTLFENDEHGGCHHRVLQP